MELPKQILFSNQTHKEILIKALLSQSREGVTFHSRVNGNGSDDNVAQWLSSEKML